MGSEQSSSYRSERQHGRNYSQQQESQGNMSPAEVKRLLEIQRQQFENKCQQMIHQAAAQNQTQAGNSQNPPTERLRTPYSYTRDDLQIIRDFNTPQTLYPNLNVPPSTAYVQTNQYQNNNNPFVTGNNDYGFRPAPTAPPAPCAPPAPSNPPAPPRAAPGPRPRSVSRPRFASRDRGSSQNRDVMDCPTCLSKYGTMIFQCNNGHSSCSDCKTRGRDCGICWQPITNRRNYEVENMVAQTKVPCLHKTDGCKLYIKMSEMTTHVNECPFKEQRCPLASVFGNCSWRGKLNHISSHFDNAHPSQCKIDVDSEVQLRDIIHSSQQVHLVILGVYNFLLHVKVSEADCKIYMAVQLIGTKMSASKWLYEIHVFNKGEPRRKYSYTDNCSSSSESVNDIFKDGNCAVLPVSYAKTFINHDALDFKFFIKKMNDGKREFVRNQRGGRRNH